MNDYNFLNDPAFLNARDNKKHFLFKNVNLVPPTWGQIIDTVDTSLRENLLIKITDNFGIITHNGQRIENVNTLITHVSAITNSKNVSAHCYISLTSFSKSFGKHKDSSDVWYWQAIGSVKWSVYDDACYEYVLEPNDIVYVLASMYHESVPLTPRVGISLGLDY